MVSRKEFLKSMGTIVGLPFLNSLFVGIPAAFASSQQKGMQYSIEKIVHDGQYPSLDYKGNFLAYFVQTGQSKFTTYVRDLANDSIIAEIPQSIFPRISGDKKHLIYEGGAHNLEIIVRNLETGDDDNISNHPSMDHIPWINENGSRRLFISRRGGMDKLFWSDSDEPKEVPNSKDVVGFPEISGNGYTIIWGNMAREIRAYDLPTHEKPNGENYVIYTGKGAYLPSVDHSGKKVVFMERNEQDKYNVYMAYFDKNEWRLRNISNTNNYNDSSPIISPDGNTIIYVRDKKYKKILRIHNLKTNNSIELLNAPGVLLTTGNRPLASSYDGRTIVYEGGKQSKPCLYLVKLKAV